LLDLKKDIYTKFFATVVVLFFIVFAAAYILIKDFLVTTLNPEQYDMVMIIDTYNTIWAEVFILFALLSGVVFLFVKFFTDRLLRDIEHFTEYIEEINKKNYDAIIKIQHYTEFLRMALTFKNLVKRLKPKSK